MGKLPLSHLGAGTLFCVVVVVAASCSSSGGGKADAAVQTAADGAADLKPDQTPEAPPQAPPDAGRDLTGEALPDGDSHDRGDASLCCPVSTVLGCSAFDAGGTRSPVGFCPTIVDAFPVSYEIRPDANGCDMVVQIGTELHFCNVPPEPRDASDARDASDTTDR